jgi:hypothetical protein
MVTDPAESCLWPDSPGIIWSARHAQTFWSHSLLRSWRHRLFSAKDVEMVSRRGSLPSPRHAYPAPVLHGKRRGAEWGRRERRREIGYTP